MKAGLKRNVTIHGLAGAAVGYVLLHPVSMVIYWMFSAGDASGVLQVLARSFSLGHLHMAMFFVILGAFIGVFQGLYVNRLAKLYGKVESLSLTDELTGLSNRRHLFYMLEREIARHRRHNSCLTLAMIDIDHFKEFNDKHGHPAGDEVLRSFGKILSESVREIDIVARYGGEEFVVVFPAMVGQDAFGVIERLRAKVENHAFSNSELRPDDGITISAGIAALPTNGLTSKQLIRAADKALYDAKRAGRNTTKSSIPPPSARARLAKSI